MRKPYKPSKPQKYDQSFKHTDFKHEKWKSIRLFLYKFKKKNLNHQILKSISTITEMLSLDMNISHSMVKLILFFTKIE